MFWPALVYMSLIAMLFLWSIVIWLMDFSAISTMIRACSKLMFQSISILTAVSGVFLLGSKPLICLPLRYVWQMRVSWFWRFLPLAFRQASNRLCGVCSPLAKQRDMPAIWKYMISHLCLASWCFIMQRLPRMTQNRKSAAAGGCLRPVHFLFVGMKRIAIPAVVLFIFVALIVRCFKNKKKLIIVWGVAWVVFFFLYIYAVRSGLVSKLLHITGIDMMGRDYLWSLANDYYDLSITYVGHGFEYVDTIVTEWYNSGIINHPYPFHNDILKVFVEMGFPGFVFWTGIQYIITPIFWMHYADEDTALLYLSNLSYMTMTYLTDNTSFSFWCTMALRLLPLAYSVQRRKPPKPQVWKPKNKKEMQDRIRIMMQEM